MSQENDFDIEMVKNSFYKMHFVKAKGIEYFLPEFCIIDIQKFKKFQLRADDIWLISFPKSGTTWVQEIIYVILNDCNYEKSKSAKMDDKSPFFEYPKPGGIDSINDLPSPRLIKTHLPKPFLPEGVLDKCKVCI